MISGIIYEGRSEPACEGVCHGSSDGEKPSQDFEANCDGVTGVKVLPRINGV